MEKLYSGDEIKDEQIYIENKDVNINEFGLEISRKELYKALKDL